MARMTGYKMEVLFLKILWLFMIQITNTDVVKYELNPEDYVKISSQPAVLQQGAPIVMKYQCQIGDYILGLHLVIDTDLHTQKIVFEKIWRCASHQLHVHLRRTVHIVLPRKIRYKPSYWNKVSVTVDKATLQAFMMTAQDWAQYVKSSKDDLGTYTILKSQRTANIAKPYDRPERPRRQCFTWWKQIVIRWQPYTPQCPAEKDIFYGVQYPVMLPGNSMGVQRLLPNFKSKHRRMLSANGMKPKFTISMWLYVIEYCPSERSGYCSIFQRLSWDDYFYTPLIYVNRYGMLKITTVTRDGLSVRIKPDFVIPHKQWFHLVMNYKDGEWTLHITYGARLQHHFSYTHRLEFPNGPWYKDTEHLHIFGGSEMVFTFKGIIGEAIVYRGKYIAADKLKRPSSDHPMFKLDLDTRQQQCNMYHKWMAYRNNRKRRKEASTKEKLRKVTCPSLSKIWLNYIPVKGLCMDYASPKPSGYRHIYLQIRRWKVNITGDALQVGENIFDKVETLLGKDDLPNLLPVAMEMLKVASCLGNHDATFMLATILDQGVTMPPRKQKALSYLYLGALDGHRWCLMGLGNKHVYGLDGLPIDHEQAYAYFQQVAARTQDDYDSASEKQVQPSSVRLIDPFSVEDHTEIDGDLIQWYKHWAARGDFFAQKELASILYWGRKGITRDMAAAAEYYRMAAETGDARAMYDYGIILLKGHGVKNDTAAAVKQLQMAADKGWTPALNTLGWHAMNNERDYAKALDFFIKASDGGNADASFNIGHMYLHGKLPERRPFKYQAFQYFASGASKHQKDAGVYVAMYNMRGHPACGRNVDLALMWVQDIAEKNPSVTYLLTKGVVSYRAKHFGASLLYYAMAAVTGTELGHFNLAYLCEENLDDVTDLLDQECKWTNYNFTVQRKSHKIHSYSWIKMGDFYWYGYQGNRDFGMATRMYANAAYRGDPQAIFNLALLVEEDIDNPVLHEVWANMSIPKEYWHNNVTLLMDLFSRCKEANDADGYLACTLAFYKVWVIYFWVKFGMYIKLLLTALVCGIVYSSVQWCYLKWRTRPTIELHNV